MASTPAARPSSPSTKFTAFIATTTITMVRNVHMRPELTVTPPIGSW